MNPAFARQLRSLPDQLRWAGDLEAPALPRPTSVMVAGMGGSGISGDFAAVLAERHGVRLYVVKGYELPRWAASERPLVVAISYSGNTEETLSVAEAAASAGLDMVGISSGGTLADMALTEHVLVPGGNQPRASLGYLLGALCRVLEGASILPEAGLDEAAEVAAAIYSEAGSAEWAGLIDTLAGRIVIPWAGSPLTAPVAQRWKTQINENAKAPAWWSVLPEADHNEIMGFVALADVTRERTAVVPLRDVDDHPRVDVRFEHTRRLTEAGVTWADPVPSRGTGPLARMVSLAAVADVVTLGLADRYGVDPESVALIEDLKQSLKESG